MNTIRILATQAIIIGTLAFSPHGPSTLTKSKFVDSFTKTKDSLTGQLEVHLDVLVHHNQRRLICVNIDVSGIIDISELEGEWICEKLESQLF
jgi:hypothetical protein